MAEKDKNTDKKPKEKIFTKKKIKAFFVDMVILFVGCCMGAFATVSILIPNGLSSGGLTGIVRILQNYVSLDFSIMYYIGAFIILIASAILLGIKEARKIVIMTIMYPAVLMLFENIDFRLLESKDMILAAIYCGVFSGICNGIIISRGYSSGGMDTIAKIVQKKFLSHIDLSKIMMVLDSIVIISSGVVFGKNVALYALVTTVIISKVMDMVIFGFDTKVVKMEIISSHYNDIAQYIMEDLGRGVTFDEVTGAYTGEKRLRLVSLCSPRESVVIKQFVANIDRSAFVTVLHVDTVWGNGEGFKAIDKEEG